MGYNGNIKYIYEEFISHDDDNDNDDEKFNPYED